MHFKAGRLGGWGDGGGGDGVLRTVPTVWTCAHRTLIKPFPCVGPEEGDPQILQTKRLRGFKLSQCGLPGWRPAEPLSTPTLGDGVVGEGGGFGCQQ